MGGYQRNCSDYRKNHFYDRVGKAIRQARADAQLDQQELARRIGVSASTLGNAEEGHTCSLIMAARIAEALDVTLDALVPLEAIV